MPDHISKDGSLICLIFFAAFMDASPVAVMGFTLVFIEAQKSVLPL